MFSLPIALHIGFLIGYFLSSFKISHGQIVIDDYWDYESDYDEPDRMKMLRDLNGRCKFRNRIYRGYPSKIGEYPAFATILRMNDKLWCSGVMIDTDTVLSAAHCFKNWQPGSLKVRAAKSNAREPRSIMVRNVCLSKNFKPPRATHDFAIIKLEDHFSLKDHEIGLACLPSQPLDGRETVRILGNGERSGGEGSPGHGYLPWYYEATRGQCPNPRESMMCLFPTMMNPRSHPCSGDSGGPGLVKRASVEVVGVHSKSKGKDCNERDQSDLYAVQTDLWALKDELLDLYMDCA